MRSATGSASSTPQSICCGSRRPRPSRTSRRQPGCRDPPSIATSRDRSSDDRGARRATSEAPHRRDRTTPCLRGTSDASVPSSSTPSRSSTSSPPLCCRSSWWPRRSGSPGCRSPSTCSTSMGPTCCASPDRSGFPIRSRRRSPSAPSSTVTVSRISAGTSGSIPGTQTFPLWLRGRAIGVMIAFGRPAAAVAGDGPPGRRRGHPRRSVHRCLRPGPATQAADGRGRDPAEPASAPDLADHRGRGGREHPAQLRGGRRLVRRHRERRRRVDHPGRRPRRLDARGGEQRRGLGALCGPAGAAAPTSRRPSS